MPHSERYGIEGFEDHAMPCERCGELVVIASTDEQATAEHWANGVVRSSAPTAGRNTSAGRQETTMATECPTPSGPRYSCYFCHRLICGYQAGCCSRKHPDHYASVCLECALALDTLNQDTVLGRVHRTIVRKANTRTADDIGV